MPAIILPVPHQQIIKDLAAIRADAEDPIDLTGNFKMVDVQPVLGGTRISCAGQYMDGDAVEDFATLDEVAERLSNQHGVTSMVSYAAPLDPDGQVYCFGPNDEQTRDFILMGLLARKAQAALGDGAVSITAPDPQDPRLSDWTDAVAWVATRPFSSNSVDKPILTRCLEAGADLRRTDFMGVSLLDRVADKDATLAQRLADTYPAKRRPSPG